MYKRKCPSCNKEVSHTNKYNRDQAQKIKRICTSCSRRKYSPDFYESLYRKCPSCGNDISYSRMGDKVVAEGASSLCKKCMISEGKFKKGCTPNKKPVYQCWLDKYGKKEADRLDKIRKEKWSNSFSGKNNPMYGRPTPKGAGNGWSGWYRGWFFRSILELSYMIKVIERYNLEWKNAECSELTIPYIDYKGNNRTYRADFLICNKYLVDCKPKNLHSSKNNILKKEAAEKFCENKGYIFKYSDIPKISDYYFQKLYKLNKIKLTNRYAKKYEERYEALE